MNLFEYVKRKGNIPSLWMSGATVCAGTGAAAIRGNMEVLPATICLVFAIFAQLTACYYHAWFEMRHNSRKVFPQDSLNYIENRSEDMRDPFLTRVMREAASVSFILSMIAGMSLLAIARPQLWWWFILMGGFIFAQTILFHLGKTPLISTPASMVMTFLIFGPVGVISTSLIQSQAEVTGSVWNFFDTAPSLFLGPAAGLLALVPHLIFSYSNYLLAPEHVRTSLTRLISPRGVVALVLLCGLGMFILMTVMVITDVRAEYFLLVPAFLGLALNTFIGFRLRNATVPTVNHLYTVSLANFTLTFILALIICIFTGFPSDSNYLYWH